MKLVKKTSLEQSEDVADTLEWKIKTIEESGLPIESSLADYIALAVDNLDNELKYISSIEKQITDKKRWLKSQIENIKVSGAGYLSALGIDKLSGVICSSVTITAGREAKEETIEAREFKLLITEAEMQELLIGLGKAEMAKTQATKTTAAAPAKLKINKKKVKADFIDELEANYKKLGGTKWN